MTSTTGYGRVTWELHPVAPDHRADAGRRAT